MKALAIFLIVLVAAVVAGNFVSADPGFIVIGYGGKVVRTTFAFFLLVLAVAVIGLFVLMNILRNVRQFPLRLQRRALNKRRQRAYDSLANGLLAMANGDFAAAERLFTRGIDDDNRPEVHYLAAAEAAQAAKASGKRDNYLNLAREVNPELRTALDMKRAQWLLDGGRVDDARPLVAGLEEKQSGDPRVLKLRLDLYRQTDDNAALLALIPDLRRDRVISHDDSNKLERASAEAMLLHECPDIAALRAFWFSLSKGLRAEPKLLSAYVRGLCGFGADDEAEALVRKQLERVWNSALAALYGEIQCEPPARQLRKLEAWSITRGDDAGLRLARARQAIRAGLWGQARTQIEALMQTSPSPLLHQLLAAIAEGQDDTAAAIAHRQAGLELATGEPHKALLPPPVSSVTTAH